jgi:hypothetical protein
VAGDGAVAEARARPALDFAPGTHQASVEAWVAARSGSRLTTPVLAIETAHATVTPGSPEAGSRVWAFGTLTPSGDLDARWVDVDAIGGGAPLPPDLEKGGLRGSGSHAAERAGEARDVEHADHGIESHDVEDAAEPGEGESFGEVEDVGEVEDAGEIDDVGEVEDLPEIDDGETPEAEELDLPEIDEGMPDIDDGDIPDIDVDDAADFEFPDVEGDLPEIDDD